MLVSDETYARRREAIYEHLADEDVAAMQFVYHGGFFCALGLLVQAQRVLSADGEVEA